jgi:hypothetical protein
MREVCLRDFLTVMLILRDRDQFADNWIYIHDPVPAAVNKS